MGNLEQLHASGMVVYATEGGVANSTWSLGSGYFLPLLFFSFPSLFFLLAFFLSFTFPLTMERRDGALGGDLEDAVLTAQVSQCLVVHHSKKALFRIRLA